MARILGEESHTLAIQDPISRSVVTFHYRRPTSEERVAYQLSAFRLDGGERRLLLGETRLRFGLEIITGFAPGDFMILEDGREAPLDPVRHGDWKLKLADHAPDLVSYLAQVVFEGLRVARGDQEWG